VAAAKPQDSEVGSSPPIAARRARAPVSKPPDSPASRVAGEVKQADQALRAGRVDEAMDAYRKAIATVPGYAPAHRGLGAVLVMKGKDGEAKASYEKYLQLAPSASDAPRIRALLEDM